MTSCRFLLVLACAAAARLGAQAPVSKPRVAVLDFDYATVHSYVTDLFGNDVDIGKGIADMLVTNLVRDGHYSVIERKQLDRILQEQNFQQSGRADPTSAVKLAKLLGVDAIIIGSITQFGRDDKKLGIGGGVRVGGIGIGGIGRKSAKAIVQIDARIVSTTTAEILAVATGHGESKRSGASLLGGVAIGGVAAGGGFDMSSSNFGSTIIGEATRLAVDSLTTEVVGGATRITPAKIEVHALVADVSGADIVVNAGTNAGIRVGAEYDVVRPGREIKDPATGRVLRRLTTAVGKLKITQADDESASGTLTGGPARVGDCVGACPANAAPGGGGGGGQEQSQAAPASPGGGALPALYTAPVTGAFTWGMYNFNGGEHFKYNVSQTEEGRTDNGSYTIDAQKQGAQLLLAIAGSLGSDSYSSTTAITPGQGIPMMQLAGLGPAAIVLFSPAMFGGLFMGHQWQLGTGWSQTHNGDSSSFKVESTCSYGGVQGLRGVLRKNDQVMMDMCVSPNVGLPLAETFNDDNGRKSFAWQLVEFHP